MSEAPFFVSAPNLSATIRTTTKLKKGDSARYRFYAGFSPDFVKAAILGTPGEQSIIFDPWNGAGTTTTVAAELGYKAVGIDVNPAMVVVSRARLTDDSSWKRVVAAIPDHWEISDERTEVLSRWLSPKAASTLRGFERALLSNCGASSTAWGYDAPEQLTSTQALAAFVMGAVTRKLLQKFQSSNPTWIRLRVPPENRIDFSKAQLREALKLYVDGGQPFAQIKCGQEPLLRLGNSETITLDNDVFDLVLTSPPYCTRIDYVVSTLPELAILGIPEWRTVEQLRAEMLGGPSRNRNSDDQGSTEVCEEISSFLQAVRQHSSKAASAYYFQFYRCYFYRYARSINRIARSMKNGGTAIIVVQDSHFKNLPVRLTDWTKRQLELAGLRIVDQWGVAVPNPKALNPAALRYRTSSATIESVVIAKKEQAK